MSWLVPLVVGVVLLDSFAAGLLLYALYRIWKGDAK